MYGGRDNTVADSLERLPGRPWLWGVGAGIALVLLVIAGLHGCGRGYGQGLRPGDSFSDDNPRPATKPAVARKEQPRPPTKAVGDVAGPNGPFSLVPKKLPTGRSVNGTSAISLPPMIRTIRGWRRPSSSARAPWHTESEAEMLESLLWPPPTGPKGTPGLATAAGGQAAPSRALLHAVTVALGANNTAAARQTLARLLAGEFAGVDGSCVAEDAVAALLRQGSPESEQVVLRYLVAPPAVTPSSQGQCPARSGKTPVWPSAGTPRRRCAHRWLGP